MASSTRSLTGTNRSDTVRRLARVGVLVGLALALHLVDSALPRPVPWMRIGLANSVTVFAIFWLGASDAIVINMARIVLAGLLSGTLFGPAFFLSLGGGTVSLIGMLTFHRLFSPPLSIIGVSVAGASLHNVGQLAMLSVLFSSGYRVMNLAPVFVLVSIPVGILVGIVGSMLLRAIRLVEQDEVHGAAAGARPSEADAVV